MARPRGTPRGHGGDARFDVGQLGAAVILGAALVHAATTFSPLPWWDLSPLVVSPSMNGMGPAQALITDAVLLVGAVLVFIGEAKRGATLHVPALVLAAIGAAGVVLHGWVLPTAGLANQQLGASWAAAVIAMVAMLHGCRDERTRRLTVAVMLGFIVLLALKGAQQRFIEHPRTVANFDENREQILAAQGWSTDSPMARGYKRRLEQPDPSAWFGLSNVYASFMGAGAAALLVALIGCVRRRKQVPPWATISIAAAMLASAGALALTYSKGGIGSLAVGLATFGALTWLRRRPSGPRASRLAPVLMFAALALPIAAVVLRGLAGDRLGGGLSLLFRWFYWQGATRIAVDHPLTGVGPAGFQEAYLAARPPLSVEEVTSPHGLPFDWWATLGVFGIAWVALFAIVVWRISVGAGRAESPAADLERRPADPELDRQESRLVFLIAAVVSLTGAWLDMQTVLPHGSTVTIDRALVWLVGLLAWWIVTAAALRLARAEPAIPALAAIAAAIVLAIHAQIEMTPVQTGSASLFFVVLGAAVAGSRNGKGSGSDKRGPAIAAAAVAGVLAALVAHGAWRTWTWQGRLREAAEVLAPVADIRTRLSVPDSEPEAARHRTEALADLSQLVGRPVDAAEPWLTMLQIQRTPPAVDSLLEAEAVFRDQWKVRRAAAWLLMDAVVSLRGPQPEESDRLIRDVKQVMAGGWSDPAAPSEAATGELRAYATLLENVAAITGETDPLEEAISMLEMVAGRDPYNLQVILNLARHHAALGHPEQAARWAARALEVDGHKRLDQEVHGLGEDEREAMQRLLHP